MSPRVSCRKGPINLTLFAVTAVQILPMAHTLEGRLGRREAAEQRAAHFHCQPSLEIKITLEGK